MVYSLLIPDPASIRFLQNIRDCEASSIFEIELDGERYALKVVSLLALSRLELH